MALRTLLLFCLLFVAFMAEDSNAAAKKLDYNSYIKKEYNRLKSTDADELSAVEKILKSELNDSTASLETAILKAIEQARINYEKEIYSDIAKQKLASAKSGKNGWEYLKQANEISSSAIETIFDRMVLLEGGFNISTKVKEELISKWNKVEPLLNKAFDADRISPIFRIDETFGFEAYNLKLHALFCDLIKLKTSKEKAYSHTLSVNRLFGKHELPAILISEHFKVVYSTLLGTSVRSADRLGWLSFKEFKALKVEFPKPASLLEMMGAEQWYCAHIKPAGYGKDAGTTLKSMYFTPLEKTPGRVGAWIESSLKKYIEEMEPMVGAIAWQRKNKGDLSDPEYAKLFLSKGLFADKPRYPISLYMLIWTDQIEMQIQAKSIETPITAKSKPAWLTRNPLYVGSIEGNEVVFKWKADHPMVEQIKLDGPITRFRFK